MRRANYDEDETLFLEDGFSNGFDIGYEGPQIRQSESENIPLRVGNQTELWNKLMKEVKLKRVAGPYDHIPFENYIQSPIGLVPKDGNSGKTRLIFHLSYDFNRKQKARSLNHHTLKEKCTVKYRDLDYAVGAYLRVKVMDRGKEESKDGHSGAPVVYAGKTDVQSTFRLAPLKRSCYKWLIMKAQDPNT